METRKVIKTKDAAGKDLELVVIKPTNKIAQKANMAYQLKVSRLIRQGDEKGERLLLRSEVEDYLIKAGIWSQQDAQKMEQLGMEVRARELLLRKGGLKLSEARQLAIEMGDLRNKMLEIYQKRQQLDSATVETVAEEYRFAVLVVECTLESTTNKKYFKDYDDYIERGDEEAAIEAAQALANDLFNIDPNFRNNLYENKWLRDAGYMDKDGRYTSRDGVYVDKTGKTVDGDGRYIDAGGHYVDKYGRKVDEEGDFMVITSAPFIDDETGKEIIVGKKKKVVVKKKAKKSKKKTKKKKEVNA